MALTAKEKRDRQLQRARDEGAAQERARIEAERAKDLPPDHDIRGAVSPATAAANLAAATRPGLVASAHGAPLEMGSSGAKVIVGCKLDISYYEIQLCRMEDKFEQNMQGGRMVREAVRIDGARLRLRGTAYPRGTPPAGFPERPEIVDGAALNRGIDRDFMVAWLEQNKKSPIVINRMIFIADSDDEARGIARDLAGVKSGLAPVDPANMKNDPRMPRSTRDEVEEIAAGVRPKALA